MDEWVSGHSISVRVCLCETEGEREEQKRKKERKKERKKGVSRSNDVQHCGTRGRVTSVRTQVLTVAALWPHQSGPFDWEALTHSYCLLKAPHVAKSGFKFQSTEINYRDKNWCVVARLLGSKMHNFKRWLQARQAVNNKLRKPRDQQFVPSLSSRLLIAMCQFDWCAGVELSKWYCNCKWHIWP